MFELDFKFIKKGNKTAYLVIFIGFLFTAIGVGIIASNMIRMNSYNREAKATLLYDNEHYDDEGSVQYSPVYAYEVNGQEYTCGSSNVSSSVKPSQESVVYYKKGDPKSCMTAYENNVGKFLYIIVAVGGVVLAIGIVMRVKAAKQIKKAKYLAKNGKLIKGIPYIMEATGTVVNGKQVQRIVIDYTTPNGEPLHLKGYPRYDYKTGDADGLADLLIDPNDYNNYFIDFEIGYSGDVQVENYNGPTTVNTPTPSPEVEQSVQAMQETVQNIGNFVNSAENTVNQINNVVNTVASGTITIGGNDNNINNTNNDANNNNNMNQPQ